MAKKLSLENQKFGRLTVIKFSHKDSNWNSFWFCMCDCGNEKIVSRNHLVTSHTKSCGCLNKQTLWKVKHRMVGQRFYKIWKGIKNRCLNNRNPKFKNWGGRGITVCKRWLIFTNFRDDMLQSYNDHVKKFGEKQTTIDRVDNNKGYSPENCRFATYKEQCNNTRKNRWITFDGKKLTMKQWAEKLNIKYSIIQDRIKDGWTIEEVLTTPINKYAQ